MESSQPWWIEEWNPNTQYWVKIAGDGYPTLEAANIHAHELLAANPEQKLRIKHVENPYGT